MVTPPPVIDAGDLLRTPEAYLRMLCDWLGIEFTSRMLQWPSGPLDCDVILPPHWYPLDRTPTGFERPAEERQAPGLTGTAADVADACMPHYARLHEARMTA